MKEYKNIFSLEETDEIIDLYQKGTPIDQIVDKYNTYERNIRIVLKENQIDRKYNSFTNELYERIKYLYESGCTQVQISEIVLISDMSIRKILRRMGVKMRSYSKCNQRYKRNQHYFDEIDTQNKAYILGLLYADGNNNLNHNCITLSLQECDKEILDRIKTELEYEGKIRFNPLQEKNINHKNQYILAINDEYMSNKLNELGLVPAKSLVAEFPEYLNMSLIRHFIRGYFDGDGSVGFDDKLNRAHVSIVGTYDVISNMKNILTSMRCPCSIAHPKQSKDNNTYCLTLCGNKCSINFLDWIYEDADMKLQRKYNRYIEIKKKFHLI